MHFPAECLLLGLRDREARGLGGIDVQFVLGAFPNLNNLRRLPVGDGQNPREIAVPIVEQFRGLPLSNRRGGSAHDHSEQPQAVPFGRRRKVIAGPIHKPRFQAIHGGISQQEMIPVVLSDVVVGVVMHGVILERVGKPVDIGGIQRGHVPGCGDLPLRRQPVRIDEPALGHSQLLGFAVHGIHEGA